MKNQKDFEKKEISVEEIGKEEGNNAVKRVQSNQGKQLDEHLEREMSKEPGGDALFDLVHDWVDEVEIVLCLASPEFWECLQRKNLMLGKVGAQNLSQTKKWAMSLRFQPIAGQIGTFLLDNKYKICSVGHEIFYLSVGLILKWLKKIELKLADFDNHRRNQIARNVINILFEDCPVVIEMSNEFAILPEKAH